MMTSDDSKRLYLILLALLALLPVGVVLADQPIRTVNEFTATGEFIGTCDDFLILGDSDYRTTVTQFFDNDGNFTELRFNFLVTNGRLYNSEHPEISIADGTVGAMFKIDPQTGIVTTAGQVLHVNIPGHGIVALDAGRTIFDPADGSSWQRGQHMLFNDELDVLCSFLDAD